MDSGGNKILHDLLLLDDGGLGGHLDIHLHAEILLGIATAGLGDVPKVGYLVGDESDAQLLFTGINIVLLLPPLGGAVSFGIVGIGVVGVTAGIILTTHSTRGEQDDAKGRKEEKGQAI